MGVCVLARCLGASRCKGGCGMHTSHWREGPQRGLAVCGSLVGVGSGRCAEGELCPCRWSVRQTYPAGAPFSALRLLCGEGTLRQGKRPAGFGANGYHLAKGVHTRCARCA